MIRVHRKVVRELGVTDHRGRKPLVLLLPEGGINLGLKVKGTRRWVYVSLRAVWQLAARMEAQSIKAERAEALKAKCVARGARQFKKWA
jgi:hypothetical protein